jgi:hypothetical protein
VEISIKGSQRNTNRSKSNDDVLPGPDSAVFVFYPGRHGTILDLVEDKHSIKLIESIEALAAVHKSGIGPRLPT